MDYLLAFGGKDLSCYFFENGCPKTKIHPKSGIPVPLFPPILEIPQSDRLRGLIKANKRKTIFYGVGCPTKIPSEKPEEETKLVTSGYWGQEPLFHIGQITRKERPLRIINTLTGTTRMMKVCDEDSINTIKAKYTEKYNFHAGSYIWRKDYKNVCLCTLKKTLILYFKISREILKSSENLKVQTAMALRKTGAFN